MLPPPPEWPPASPVGAGVSAAVSSTGHEDGASPRCRCGRTPEKQLISTLRFERLRRQVRRQLADNAPRLSPFGGPRSGGGGPRSGGAPGLPVGATGTRVSERNAAIGAVSTQWQAAGREQWCHCRRAHPAGTAQPPAAVQPRWPRCAPGHRWPAASGQRSAASSLRPGLATRVADRPAAALPASSVAVCRQLALANAAPAAAAAESRAAMVGTSAFSRSWAAFSRSWAVSSRWAAWCALAAASCAMAARLPGESLRTGLEAVDDLPNGEVVSDSGLWCLGDSGRGCLLIDAAAAASAFCLRSAYIWAPAGAAACFSTSSSSPPPAVAAAVAAASAASASIDDRVLCTVDSVCLTASCALSFSSTSAFAQWIIDGACGERKCLKHRSVNKVKRRGFRVGFRGGARPRGRRPPVWRARGPWGVVGS